MGKSHVYLTTSKMGARPVTRIIPTDVGSFARVAVHIPGARSLELWVDHLGRWSLDTMPGLTHGGDRKPIAQGSLTDDSERVTIPREMAAYLVEALDDGLRVNRGAPFTGAQRSRARQDLVRLLGPGDSRELARPYINRINQEG